jgi:hypothetical protein
MEEATMLMRTLMTTGLIVGVASGAIDAQAREKDVYLPPKGSTIVLNQPLTAGFGSAKAFIQFGKPVSKEDRHAFYPTCYFYLNTVNQTGTQTINPAQFTIKKSSNYSQQGFSAAPSRWQLATADLDGLQLAQMTDVYKMSEMRLEPNAQQVISLTCYIRYSYGTAITPFLHLDQIEEVLGSVATIEASAE